MSPPDTQGPRPVVSSSARPTRSRPGRLAVVAVLGLLAGFVVLRWVFVPYRITGPSMEPALEGGGESTAGGDIVLVNRLAYRWGQLRRWDVVVVRAPDGQEVIKRVVGLPGETLEVRDGAVLVGGEKLEPPAGVFSGPVVSKGPHGRGPIEIGPAAVFLLGDSSYLSLDSRAWGAVHTTEVLGRAELVILPWRRLGWVH